MMMRWWRFAAAADDDDENHKDGYDNVDSGSDDRMLSW